jgi:hypothetical protein
MKYIRPEEKELYIAHNDPKQPVLLYRDEGPWSDLPSGCWAPLDVIEYYHIDWNNQNVDEPFITQITGGTILSSNLFLLRFFKRIRKPNPKQLEVITKYKFYEMVHKFDQERIRAGWWK